MVSHNVSEGIKPRNLSILHWVKGFSAWKPVAPHAKRGECVGDVPGSEAMAGHSMIHNGTWDSHVVPQRSFQRAEEAEDEVWRYGSRTNP